MKPKPDRRHFLRSVSMAAAGSAATGALMPLHMLHAQPKEDPRFLIVLTASGGASIIDSFMAIRASESRNASTINTYPDTQVVSIDGSPLRAVDRSNNTLGTIPVPYRAHQSDFLRKHHRNMLVATVTTTSVNHSIGQKRAVTGNEAWNGRTLQELVALQHGHTAPLANVALATGTSFIEPGTDPTLPGRCFGEPVAAPALWPLSLHGTRGLTAPPDRFVRLGQAVRDTHLDPESRFAQVFGNSQKLARWLTQRQKQTRLEASDLVTRLMLFPDSKDYPLRAHGLSESADGQRVRTAFPRYHQDPLEAQGALTFLLLKHRISVAVTLGPNFNAAVAEGADRKGLKEGDLINTPIAFDFSHQDHRDTQAFMWNRVLSVADRLIMLLKSEEYREGQSFWDRTLIYVATDFGRDKVRPSNADSFGTSHHLNNGVLVISPQVRGNRVLGGVDPNTGLTYGFDPRTGAPEPGRNTSEAEIFAGLLQALGVDTTGASLPAVPALAGA